MSNNTQQRKTEQLNMNPSTASQKLIKDIIFDFIKQSKLTKCFQCGQEMTRDNFSIEHKTPWLDSEKPVELFFSLDNISYSHHRCNVSAARRKQRTVCHGTINEYDYGKCRCKLCKAAKIQKIYAWRKKVGHR